MSFRFAPLSGSDRGMVRFMRAYGVAVALLLVGAASADRLIFIPTGKKTPLGTLRGEWVAKAHDPSRLSYSLGYGLTKALEVEAVRDALASDRSRDTLNLSYSFLDPVVGFLPGLTVGVLDAADRTPQRRSFFVATTMRLGLDGDYNSDTPAELTLGGGTERFRGLFVGLSLPLTNRFRILAEHDSRSVRAGVEWWVTRQVAVRNIQEDGASYWSATYTRKL